MKRRALLKSAAGVSLAALFAMPVGRVAKPDAALNVDALLFDPDIPVGGNPKGDVTIVAFFDYNCGYCRKAAPELDKLVAEDGNIRLVYKDWPILSESSVIAAQLALGAKYQGKYEDAHRTMMKKARPRSTAESLSEELEKAGIDRQRLARDLEANAAAIGALLGRNNEQAEALGLPGTPVYLVGPYKVAAALDYKGFKDVVADARRRAAEK